MCPGADALGLDGNRGRDHALGAILRAQHAKMVDAIQQGNDRLNVVRPW